MNIAVIAANGRSGQAFTQLALKAGHSIRAGVHSTQHQHFTSNSRLTVMHCDATSEQDLMKLLAGQDAVVSFIGHVKGSQTNVQTAAITNTMQAMDRLGIHRIVSLTGTGVRFPGDSITLIDRFLNFSIGIIDPARVKDGKDHVNVLMHSDLAWTIIRVLKLQDSKPKSYRLREHGPTKIYTSREEVAQAVLEVLEKNSFIQCAPIIGKE